MLALLAICLALLGAISALAEPRFPALSGRIVDDANLLSADDRRTLEQELSAAADGEPAGPPVASVPEPDHVTSQDPRRVAGWSTLPVVVIPAALLAGAAALLLGLPFVPVHGPGAFEVFASTLGATVLVRLPYLWPSRHVPRRDQPATDALDRAA